MEAVTFTQKYWVGNSTGGELRIAVWSPEAKRRPHTLCIWDWSMSKLKGTR